MKTDDPAKYRRNSEPFPSVEASNEALAAFFAEVQAARDRHRIADVIVLCEVNVMTDDGEIRGGASSFLGDSTKQLPILAREYGAARERFEEDLGRIIAAARKSVRRK